MKWLIAALAALSSPNIPKDCGDPKDCHVCDTYQQKDDGVHIRMGKDEMFISKLFHWKYQSWDNKCRVCYIGELPEGKLDSPSIFCLFIPE